METIITIENLKCHGCANTITKGLMKMPEVLEVIVDVEDNTVVIIYDGDENSRIKFKKKLEHMGYPEMGHNSGISVAKSYVSCAVGRISMKKGN